MTKAFRASLLVLLLACTARADWMQNGSPAPPPSQPTSASQDPALDGIMPNGPEDSLTQTVLDLIAALPLLF